MKRKTLFSIIFFLIFPVILSARIDTVIIDPGHGGKDPGASNKKLGLEEKEVNLRIALFLKKMIERRIPWVKVHLTRETDTYLTLKQRVNFVHRYSRQKALFISIHTNSHDRRKKVEGIEVFYYNRNLFNIEDERIKEISKLFVDDYSDELKPALIKMVNAKLKYDSKMFAHKLAKGLKMASREPIRRISSCSFYVVSYAVIPSVLVEVGFISSKKFLKSYYQKKIAKGILFGILSFIKKEDKF